MLTKLAYSIRGLAEATDLSVDSIRAAINAGELVPSYPNRKPIIPVAEAQRWIDSLPTEAPRRSA